MWLAIAGAVPSFAQTQPSFLTTNGSGQLNRGFTVPDGLAVNFGTAVIVSKGGARTAYQASADTNAARGTALQTAKTAAVSGDTIVVGPGTYDTRDLFKDGVNWHFMSGAKIIYTGSADAAVWDLSSTGVTTAVTCSVTGHGSFKHQGSHASGQLVSTVAILQASSNVYFECDEILHSPSSSSNASSAFRHHGGTVTLHCPNIQSTVGQAVWWSDGELFFNGNETVATTTAVYTGADANPYSGAAWVSGYFWGKCSRAKSTNGQGVQLAGAASARSWLEVDEIIGNSAGAALLMGVGKNYAFVKKVTQSGTGPGVQIISGENWLNAQKVTGGTGSSGWAVQCLAGSSWMDILHIEPVAGSATAMIRCQSGTHNVRVMDATAPSTTMNGVQISGGTLRLVGARLDCALATSANPVLKSGGTLRLRQCVLISDGTRDSISAATSQTVSLMGCYANTALDSDVTDNLSGLTVDTDVQ